MSMKTIVQITSHYGFKPAIRAILEKGYLSKVGELKKVIISIREAKGIEKGREWLLRKGIFLDLLVHAWGLIIELLGISSPNDVEIIEAKGARYDGAPIERETSGRVRALLRNLVEADILVGKGIGVNDKSLEIRGSRGTLRANLSSGRVSFVGWDGKEELLQKETRDDSYEALLEEALLRKPPRITFRKGLLALQLVEKARKELDYEDLELHPLGTPPSLMAERIRVGGCDNEAYRSAGEANRAVIREMIVAAKQSIDEFGDFCMAIPGGTTFPPVIETLAGDEAFKDSIDIGRWHWFQGDEHCVPHDDGENNYHLALEGGLGSLISEGLNAYRITTQQDESGKLLDLNDLREVVADYEAKLRAIRPDGRFDLVILGLGAHDCHVASLLPSKESWVNPLTTSEKIYDVVEYPETYGLKAPLRVSLTLKGISSARRVILFCLGPKKSSALHSILTGEANVSRRPGSLIRALRSRAKIITDREGAELITSYGSQD